MGKIKVSEKWILRISIGLLLFYGAWSHMARRGYVPRFETMFHQDKLAKYQLTEDWFSLRIPNWEKLLETYKGKPFVRYLEVGVFEGRSALWMLENILTHPTAHATAVDIFLGDLEKRFRDNLQRSGRSQQVTVLKGDSKEVLRGLPMSSYDIIYIDGSHLARNVLADAVLSWPLLKPGGLLIFDDFLWKLNEYPFELRPRAAIEFFISLYQSHLEVIHTSWQMIVRKSTDICQDCIRVGKFAYSWDNKQVVRLNDKKTFVLTSSQRSKFEKSLLAKDFGIKGLLDKKLENMLQEQLKSRASR